MIILYASSAWAYHRTPPVVRHAEIPEEVAYLPYPEGGDLPPALKLPRSNAADSTRAVYARMRLDLKGIDLPAHVLVDHCSAPRSTAFLTYHRTRKLPPRSHLIALGGDLYVPTPELALLHLAQTESPPQLALDMFEACGTYAGFCPTGPARYTLDQLVEAGFLDHAEDLPGITSFYDADSRPLPLVDSSGDPLPWKPAVNRFGKLDNLWRRPPLTSSERLACFAKTLGHGGSAQTMRLAASWVQDGSASPLETRMALILCLDPRYGGEAWPRPHLNQRIDLTPEAQTLSGGTYRVADLFWPDLNVDLEVNGMAYHADRHGFAQASSRRAALEAMGCTVLEISFDQMRSYDKLDAMLQTFSAKTGMPLQDRTKGFVAAREHLLDELFGSRRS